MLFNCRYLVWVFFKNIAVKILNNSFRDLDSFNGLVLKIFFKHSCAAKFFYASLPGKMDIKVFLCAKRHFQQYTY